MSIQNRHPRHKRGSLSASALAALLLLAAAAPLSADIPRQHNTGGSDTSSASGSTHGSSSSSSSSGSSNRGSSGGGTSTSSWQADRSGGRGHGGRAGRGDGRRGGRGDGGGRGSYGRGDGGRGHGSYGYGRGGHRHGGHRHGHRVYRGGNYGYYGWGGYYGGWGGWWPWWYPGGSTVIVERDRYGYGYGGDGSGALDLDLSPEEAQIFIDGEYVGEADDYDGFPTFLWLPRGTYDVAFYLPGYQTIVRQYTVRPGVVIDIEDRMVEGDSIQPAELMRPKSTERRDARIERNAEQNAAVDRQEAEAAEQAARGGSGQQVGRLVLSLYPPDAAIYLDGHFLGTAEEIGQLSAGLVVEPGQHELEVVRPGYETERRTVNVTAGGKAEIKFDLEEN